MVHCFSIWCFEQNGAGIKKLVTPRIRSQVSCLDVSNKKSCVRKSRRQSCMILDSDFNRGGNLCGKNTICPLRTFLFCNNLKGMSVGKERNTKGLNDVLYTQFHRLLSIWLHIGKLKMKRIPERCWGMPACVLSMTPVMVACLTQQIVFQDVMSRVPTSFTSLTFILDSSGDLFTRQIIWHIWTGW